jgi:hypothetical protein
MSKVKDFMVVVLMRLGLGMRSFSGRRRIEALAELIVKCTRLRGCRSMLGFYGSRIWEAWYGRCGSEWDEAGVIAWLIKQVGAATFFACCFVDSNVVVPERPIIMCE